MIRKLFAVTGIVLSIAACSNGDSKTKITETHHTTTGTTTSTAPPSTTMAEEPAVPDAAAEPTVVECLPGTPGPARWSDGTTRFSQWCYDNNGGVANASAEGNAGLPASPSPGDDCSDPDATTVDGSGRTLYCNPTVNGRNAGNLVWQLQP
ncbi:MAG: hypothetical protein LLG14_16555 [Nocardiaceae bacterium]|nr:hypothetical protein [Nocardiaceae bacterium]